MATLLRQARDARGWSSLQLRRKLADAAKRLGVQIASETSLRVMLSRWENGASHPEAVYCILLQEVFGLDARALGLGGEDDSEAEDVTGLVYASARRNAPAEGVLAYFDRQLGQHAQLDNLAGPSFVLDTALGQLRQVEQLAASGALDAMRLSARYAEFAGWLHQDLGNEAEALRLTTRAVDLAETAGDRERSIYNLMRRANILTTSGDARLAESVALVALRQAKAGFPYLVPVCLRQQALVSARLRDAKGAKLAIDQANGLVGATVDPSDALSPYCTQSYLQMEEALCMLVLGLPAEAEAASRLALAGYPEELSRDRTLCLTRRASALVELREVEEACHTALLAIEGVRSAPSGRTLHMLRRVVTRLRPFHRTAPVRDLTEALAEVA